MNAFLKKIQDNFERKKLYQKLLPSKIPYPLSKKVYKKLLTLQKKGIVKNIELHHNQYPDEPFQHCIAALPHGYGHDFFSFESAMERALGEAVERNLWRNSNIFYKNKIITSSRRALKKDALDFTNLIGFSAKQISENTRFQYTEDTPFTWIPTTAFATKKSVLCPLQFFSARFISGTKEPLLRGGTTIGLATGVTYEQALLKSILELIEREAFMITYLNSISPNCIDIEALAKDDADIAHIQENFKKFGVTPYVTELISDFPVPIMLGIAVDETDKGPVYALGACASFDTKNAIVRSLSEALIVRQSIKHTHKKFDGVLSARGRLNYWAQPEQRGKLDFLIAGKKIKLTLAKSSLTIAKQLATLRIHLANNNLDVYTVTLSDKKLHNLGYYSVMSMSPNLHPMHLEESLPHFSSQRLIDVPKKCGYTPSDIINFEPHPFP